MGQDLLEKVEMQPCVVCCRSVISSRTVPRDMKLGNAVGGLLSMEQSNEFREGWEAYVLGSTLGANPYPEETKKCVEWVRGYRTAERTLKSPPLVIA